MIKPEIEVEALEHEIVPFVTKAQKLTIASPKDMAKASEVRSQLKAYAKEVKEKKEKISKPAYASYKSILAFFKPVEDKVDAALSFIDDAMISYQTEQKKTAEAEEAKIAARVGEGKGKFTLDTAVRKMEEVDKPAEKVGNTQFITVECFEVEDIAKIPTAYLLANEVEIRKAMKAGLQLPGVKYWSEERPRNI